MMIKSYVEQLKVPDIFKWNNFKCVLTKQSNQALDSKTSVFQLDANRLQSSLVVQKQSVMSNLPVVQRSKHYDLVCKQ